MPDVIAEIQACKFLYLESITEPADNELRIVILEAGAGSDPDPLQFEGIENTLLKNFLTQTKPIVHGEGHRKFELFWSSYIGYSVVNESYSNGEPKDSIGEGGLLSIYTQSQYLEYLSKASFADASYPGPFRHWALYCLNHTIDVASIVEPEVSVLHAG